MIAVAAGFHKGSRQTRPFSLVIKSSLLDLASPLFDVCRVRLFRSIDFHRAGVRGTCCLSDLSDSLEGVSGM